MKSHEILKGAVDAVGAKKVAQDLGVSASLVYKWCEESGDADDSGAKNPLDRLLQLVESTRDREMISWLCQHSGGFFVGNPQVNGKEIDSEFIQQTQVVIREFSELLGTMSQSLGGDGKIDDEESRKIRRRWQKLKERGEELVHACEKGLFNRK